MDSPAQRLWILERSEGFGASDRQNVCRFLGAIAILGESMINVVFVRSPELQRASEVSLRATNLRLNIERDAFAFATLDDAIVWTDAMKRAWLCRGWTEVPEESDDGCRRDRALSRALSPHSADIQRNGADDEPTHGR